MGERAAGGGHALVRPQLSVGRATVSCVGELEVKAWLLYFTFLLKKPVLVDK